MSTVLLYLWMCLLDTVGLKLSNIMSDAGGDCFVDPSHMAIGLGVINSCSQVFVSQTMVKDAKTLKMNSSPLPVSW